ncbi:accessory Sec system translocase SecA2 [Lachnospiraceae bacterium]|nr:accessory Sec system translocase SecA2 [uncultured Schaedlerella sp.]NBI60099.1 accessory Sec system translocase SecA2 [Lachnospiraceae bacterium]
MRRKRNLKRLKKIVKKVRSYGEHMAGLSDEELSNLTVEFKQRLAEGKSLDDILPEAFAAICEADHRVLGTAPYDVQVLGGIALHQGYLAEMNTGEGKTLAATMPLYLNALTGKSTILVTANDYLALRDAQEMGQVYRFMGLSVAAGVPENAKQSFTNEEKKKIYAADIVYTTHGVLGFDYLLNNLVTRAGDRFLREFYYVVIDEADSVLLDSAQTPLVISGSPRVQSRLYETADFFVTTLTKDVDYLQEENKVWFTEKGIKYAETFFQIENFYSEEFFEINRHVILALRAHVLFQKGKEYVVSNEGEVILLDGGSGRMLPGVKLRGGLHQAIEVKEKLRASRETRSMAAITFQNLFLLFPKMAGMSGTMADAPEELRSVYGAKVLVVPPNRPQKRKDLPDRHFRNAQEQFEAAAAAILEIHDTGRPVLIVVSTIGDSERMSEVLVKEKIPHNVLNANNASWEAEIIKEAGQRKAVTVATAMAGRGTDIRLGPGVEELGGLAVIGIGRMGSVRPERQARGRAGRQGDAGTSQFFVSLQDGVVEENGPENLEKYIEGRRRISKRRMKKMIHKAQRLSEESSISSRKRSVDYDKVIRRQRDLIYATRNHLLDGGELEMEKIMEIAAENIRRFLDSGMCSDRNDFHRYILDNISYRLDEDVTELSLRDEACMEACLLEKVKRGLEKQEHALGDRKRMNEFMRIAILSAVDHAWVEQVDYLQQLQSAVSGRAMAQRNVLFEYQNDGFDSFSKMERTVKENAMRNILLSDVYVDKANKLHILFP